MQDQTPDFTAQGLSYPVLALSFLAGGVAGATVALLLAPQSGRATREIMGHRLTDAADSARGLKDRVLRRSRELREEATDRVAGAASALAGRAGQKEPGSGDLKANDSPA